MSKAHVEKRRQDDQMRRTMRQMDIINEQLGRKTYHLLNWTIANFSEEDEHNMARGRKKAEAPLQSLKLTEALTFVNVAARDNGENVCQKHVLLKDKWALAFDGIISAGHPIEEDFNCAPHKLKLIEALKRATGGVTITEQENGRISIKGTALRVVVPGLPVDEMPMPTPDPIAAPVDDRLKLALERVAVLVSEAAEDVIGAAVHLLPNTARGTNKNALLEAWHGLANLPPQGVVLPKLFVMALAKQVKTMVSAGCSWSQDAQGNWSVASFTVYYEDGAWIKTACYADPYPDLTHLFEGPINWIEPPAELFKAVEAVADFNDDGWVTFVEGAVRSEVHSDEVGAVFAVPTLNTEKQFVAKNLLKIAPYAKYVDYTTYSDRMLFSGGEPESQVRGIVVCIIQGGQG